MYALVTSGPGVGFSSYAYMFVISLRTGAIVDEFKFKHQVYDQSTKGFTGAFVTPDDYLWVTTEAEILKFQLNPLRLIDRITKPIFNDLHFIYADLSTDKILICNTGLDAIEELNCDLDYIGTIRLVRGFRYLIQAAKALVISKPRRKLRNFWLRLQRNAKPRTEILWAEDMRYKHLNEANLLTELTKIFLPQQLYRTGIDLRYILFRPHILHPNFIWKINNRYLVTLKNTGEVVALKDGSSVLRGLVGPHDGLLREDIYLITQSGSGLLSYLDGIKTVKDLKGEYLEHIQVCDPNEGFIRGVDLFDDKIAVTAVSKRREITDNRPAYLSVVKLHNKQLLREIKIPHKYGTNPFSVLNVTSQYDDK